jgi:hypothetical protein
MTFDDRLVSKEQIVRAKTVLTDMHSLAAFGTALALKDQNVPWQGPREIPLEDSYAVANVIQSIVLYDTVVVDSVLLEGHAPAADLFELFPGILKGIFITLDDRLQIADIIDQVTGRGDSMPEQMTPTEWHLLRNHDLKEKYLQDWLQHQKITRFPPEYQTEAARDYFEKRGNKEIYFPHAVHGTGFTIQRSHFYLELARRLGIALSPHPHRTKYYELLTDEVKESFRRGTPERIIAFFEENALLSAVAESADLVSVNLEIPAVAELVFNYAKRTGTDLITATLDTRHSRNAQKFREWCARFSSLDDGGRASAKEQAEMLKELKNVCEVWKSDVREEVKYKTRKLSLEKLPVVGGVLKSLNMHEKTIKDPILWPSSKYSYFLFLNDLIRNPS